jgi:metal-responsive CopG/Arc/MetJ family transcriptional regulator
MKTAISIPNNVFEQAENLARKLKISRSELFTEAVKVYLKENQVEDVMAKLNEVYETAASNLDNDLLKAQAASLPKEKW